MKYTPMYLTNAQILGTFNYHFTIIEELPVEDEQQVVHDFLSECTKEGIARSNHELFE